LLLAASAVRAFAVIVVPAFGRSRLRHSVVLETGIFRKAGHPIGEVSFRERRQDGAGDDDER
jgi:hypothetical protein